jgi:serine-type D-Ala-D-Ala endopeptidase (penicillin-binding protein 7)
MKKLWLKIVIFAIVGGLAATAYALLINTPLVHNNSQSIAVKEKPKQFKLVLDDSTSAPNPKIKAEAAVVFDLESGRVLLHKNEESIRSIASLTKLATALVSVESKIDFDKVMTVTREDRDGAGRSRLRVGSQAKVRDIFHLMLICSDNCAARVVARSTGMSSEEFVAAMNALAIKLGMMHTHFADPTGLDPRNMSTAVEYSVLLKTAFDNVTIADVISKKNYSFKPINGRRIYTLHNTNRLLFGKQNIIGGKTGFIGEAGYCLAFGAEDTNGRKLGAVLLGAPTSGTRFRDAVKLLASAATLKSTVN